VHETDSIVYEAGETEYMTDSTVFMTDTATNETDTVVYLSRGGKELPPGAGKARSSGLPFPSRRRDIDIDGDIFSPPARPLQPTLPMRRSLVSRSRPPSS
jgi:hypothetical protein